jgi:hypothetical protein
MNEPLCWHHERARILEGLRRANLSDRPVFLICIEREFEIVAAPRPSTAVGPAVEEDAAGPDPPAEASRSHVQPQGSDDGPIPETRPTYVDVQYARRIADALDNLDHLRRCPTFRRFAERIVGRMT